MTRFLDRIHVGLHRLGWHRLAAVFGRMTAMFYGDPGPIVLPRMPEPFRSWSLVEPPPETLRVLEFKPGPEQNLGFDPATEIMVPQHRFDIN